jgi:hypothetical protein
MPRLREPRSAGLCRPSVCGSLAEHVSAPGLALEALGSRKEADSAFRKSREILEAIQSSPEVAQTLLGHGRFLTRDDRPAGRALVERALVMFEEMGATGWLEEARRAL